MPKYLIEVKHDATKAACDEAIKVFLDTGSHFLSKADWGCMDEEHKAWFFLEIDNKDMAPCRLSHPPSTTAPGLLNSPVLKRKTSKRSIRCIHKQEELSYPFFLNMAGAILPSPRFYPWKFLNPKSNLRPQV